MFDFNFNPLTEERAEIINLLHSTIYQKIPNSFPDYFSNNFNMLKYRTQFIENLGFTLLSRDWIKPLAAYINSHLIPEYPLILEIMSGNGALSHSLKLYDVNIIPTDNNSWVNHRWKPWLRIEEIDALSAITQYIHKCSFLICSWPDMNDTLYHCLLKMRSLNPLCKLIYIGEREGGCTASENFFSIINILQDTEFLSSVEAFKQWIGIHDKPYICK